MDQHNHSNSETKILGCGGIVTGCSGAIVGAIIAPVIVLIAFLKTSGDDVGGPLTLLIIMFGAMIIGAPIGGLLGRIIGATIARKVRAYRENRDT